MADPKEAPAMDAAPAGGGDKSSKMMMGMLGLNMVVVLAVVIVLFLGQKKQAAQQTLGQVEEGAASEHAAPAAKEGGEGHGEGGEGGHGEGGEHGAAKADAAPASDAHFFSVGDFTANLSGPASTHYAKITVNFEVSKDADEEEMKQRRPQFRDKIISLLNSKKPGDLQSDEGRSFLKEEIKSNANQYIKKGKVEGVYFSAFVIN